MVEAPKAASGLASDFPTLAQVVNETRLAYLDSAATSQKPQAVLSEVERFFREDNANIHRGVHTLSQRATALYESARRKVQILLNARSEREIIFTKGCTEAINLVAHSYLRPRLKEGDVILLSTMEHHSNIVPWQLVAEEKGARIIPIPISDDGVIDLDAYRDLLQSAPVMMVGVVHVSNCLGTINPVAEMIRLAHDAGAAVLVDGAQAGPHMAVDVQALDADFYTLSCHKLYAPTGVGVLYGKRLLLESMPPYQGGGDMIRTVSFEKTTYAEIPSKFEAGTPNIAGVIGLGAAIDWLGSINPTGDLRTSLERTMAFLHRHEVELMQDASRKLAEIPGLRLVGTAPDKASVVSFVTEFAHPHDLGTILDQEGVAIRTGHHCCMPLMKRLGVPATARASFAIYNSQQDVDQLVAAVWKAREIMA